MSSDNQAYCACLSVEYKPIELPDGFMRECWKCSTCGCEFDRKAFLQDKLAAAEAATNGAYSERNKLVVALSKLFSASIETPDVVEDGWNWVVIIDLPTGQVSWHIHDDEIPQFAHLAPHQGRAWDGHTAEEKYQRLKGLPVGQLGDPIDSCTFEKADGFVKARVKLEQRADALAALVAAVKCRDFDGIYCEDVDGTNWFDKREELLGDKEC